MSMTKAELTAENKPACIFNGSEEEFATNKERVTHENQGGVEVFIVLLDIVGIIFGCLLLVDGVEVDTRVVGLDGLQERSESVLYATSWIPFSGCQPGAATVNLPFGIDFQRRFLSVSLTVFVHEGGVKNRFGC